MILRPAVLIRWLLAGLAAQCVAGIYTGISGGLIAPLDFVGYCYGASCLLSGIGIGRAIQ